jgi:hypothetical protein
LRYPLFAHASYNLDLLYRFNMMMSDSQDKELEELQVEILQELSIKKKKIESIFELS